MKVIIIGGTGLIGSKLVSRLRGQGHQALPASPEAGVNTFTGLGAGPSTRRSYGVVEIAGPEQFRFDEFMRQGLKARHDAREVVADPQARYFGVELGDQTVPAGQP
jgi:hypothetical protein